MQSEDDEPSEGDKWVDADGIMGQKLLDTNFGDDGGRFGRGESKRSGRQTGASAPSSAASPNKRKREPADGAMSSAALKRLRKVGVNTGEDTQAMRAELAELRSQAQRGVAAAQLEVARRLLTGTKGAEGVAARRWKEGAMWAQKAAALRCEGAEEVIAYCHLIGAGDVSKDARKAYGIWKERAEQARSPKAAFWLAHCLDAGIGVNRNRTEALRWYEVAALNGSDPGAIFNVALAYYNGEGVPVNATKAVQWLLLAAEYGRDEWVEVADGVSELKSLGHARAQLLLGLCYIEGEGVDKDEETGLDWLHKAGEQGDVDAQFWLGVCYYRAVGIEEPRYEEALAWFEKAAAQGCLDSMHNVAVLHGEGKGVKRNERKAASILISNALNGCKESAKLAALCYIEARGVKRDEEGGLSQYMKATGVTEAQAQFEIGQRFVRGQGWLRTPNIARGVAWLEKAAAQHHIDAMVMLAPLLKDRPSKSSKKDTAAAIALLRSAAARGHAGAQVAMGDHHREGSAGVRANMSMALELWAQAAQGGSRAAKVRLAEFMAHAAEASGNHSAGSAEMKQLQAALAHAGPDGSLNREMLQWLEIAAEDGKAPAQVELGKQLMLRGSEADCAQAALWFQRASTEAEGHPKAMLHLAVCYLQGKGVEKKPEIGVRWLKAAAKKGDPEAAFSLSCCFASGEGIEQRADKAWMWLLRAAEGGSASAMFNAHIRLANGRGVEKDAEGARRWLVLAASAGHAKAQYNLGLELLAGGESRSREEGRAMMKRAAEQGHEGAEEVLQRLGVPTG